MKNRKWMLPLVLVALALGIGLKLAANKKKLDAAKQPVDRSGFAIPVTAFTTAITDVEGTFTVPGTLEPYDDAKVMVQAQGKLASLNVDLGSRVSKGQVLGSLDLAGFTPQAIEGLTIDHRGVIYLVAEDSGTPASRLLVLTPVPEPEAWSLLAAGLALLVGWTRRRAPTA